jgi:tRNA_anti-like
MKKVLITLLIFAALGGGYGYYLWNKPPESMATQKADLGMPAEQLFAAFKADENAANAQYVGKIIVITGKVKESRMVDGTAKVTIEAGADDATILCELDNNTQHKRTTFTTGETISMKGECAGADIDGTVMLSHCAENN